MEDDFTEALISQVFLQKSLYDKGSANFRNKILKDKLWNEIANNLGKSADECQKRWKSLRERFTRELKKENEPSGSGAIDRVQWEYYEALIFLKDHVAPRKTISNTSFNNTPSESLEDHFTDSISVLQEVTVESTAPSSRSGKRQRNDAFNSLCESLSKKVGELNTEPPTISEDFIRTSGRLINELPLHAQEEVRVKIFALISETRAKYMYKER